MIPPSLSHRCLPVRRSSHRILLQINHGAGYTRALVTGKIKGRQGNIAREQQTAEGASAYSLSDPVFALAFFDLHPGLKLAVWPRKSLSHDAGIAVSSPSPTDFSLGHNVSSKAEVDAVMERAKQAGAVIVKPARDTFWGGYAGYFQDPDGHLWEIAWNPAWSNPE